MNWFDAKIHPSVIKGAIFARKTKRLEPDRIASEACQGVDRAPKVERNAISDDVAVYYVPHTLEKCGASELSALTLADYREFAAIKHPGSRNRSMLARAVLRHALSEITNGSLSPSEWVFTRDEFGKPQVDASCPQVFFSCSHSEGCSMVAVSTKGVIGIDLACHQANFDLTIAELFLSQRETSTLGEGSSSNSLKRQAFCRLWALKEAYLKMNGEALSERIRDVEFDHATDRLTQTATGEEGAAQPEFRTWQLAAGGRSYSAALAFTLN